MNTGVVVLPVENNPKEFNANELAIIRLGEDPAAFDHYILKSMTS